MKIYTQIKIHYNYYYQNYKKNALKFQTVNKKKEHKIYYYNK